MRGVAGSALGKGLASKHSTAPSRALGRGCLDLRTLKGNYLLTMVPMEVVRSNTMSIRLFNLTLFKHKLKQT